MGRSVIQLGNGRGNIDASTQPNHRTLILDLGDVLFHYTTRNLTALARQELQSVLRSPTWVELDCGQIAEEEALARIGKDLSLDPGAIKEGLTQCRDMLRVDQDLVDEIAKIKKEMDGRLKVYAMSNISTDDFARLKTLLPDWSMFDGEFTSFEVGMAKPELGFYRHVLDKVGVSNPSSAIFVDDKISNVAAARSLGIQGIVFKSAPLLLRQLRNILFDPVVRARKYMAANARHHTSRIEDSPEFPERFSQFLIHWELKEASWLNLSSSNASEAQIKADIDQASAEAKTWNYFSGTPVGTTKTCK
jgi:FMN phosphatase YigB (HAD superfamily)